MSLSEGPNPILSQLQKNRNSPQSQTVHRQSAPSGKTFQWSNISGPHADIWCQQVSPDLTSQSRIMTQNVQYIDMYRICTLPTVEWQSGAVAGLIPGLKLPDRGFAFRWLSVLFYRPFYGICLMDYTLWTTFQAILQMLWIVSQYFPTVFLCLNMCVDIQSCYIKKYLTKEIIRDGRSALKFR
jgi:hypothetical protein